MFKSRESIGIDTGKALPSRYYNGEIYYPPNTWRQPPRDHSEVMKSLWLSCHKNNGPYSPGLPYVSGKETLYCTENRRPLWNNCTHIKTSCAFDYPVSMVRDEWEWGAQLYLPQWTGYKYPPYLGTPNTSASVSDFARARAWATMLPRFESDFKALNFIFELKDFRNVSAVTLRALKRGGLTGHLSNKETRQAKTRLSPKNHGKPPSCAEAFDGGVNSIAEAWLFNSMAIQPMLKDFAAFRAAMVTEYIEALEDFKESGTVPNTRHYSEVVRDDSSVLWVDPIFGTKRKVLDSTTFYASLQYGYKYRLDNTALAFRKYWGLTGTAEEFWNMLPFSFLLDYVFTVAKSLRLAEVDKNLDLSVLNYCETHKSIYGDAVGFEGNSSRSYPSGCIVDGEWYSISTKRFIPISGTLSSYYVRTLTEPLKYGLILPQWKVPSVGQGWNAAALAKLLFF